MKLAEIKNNVIVPLAPVKVILRDTAVYSAFLARIEYALEVLMNSTHAPAQWQLTLKRVAYDFAMAWPGNLPQRAPELDLETYAVEVIKVENIRLRTPHLVQSLSEALQEAVPKAVWLLPIAGSPNINGSHGSFVGTLKDLNFPNLHIVQVLEKGGGVLQGVEQLTLEQIDELVDRRLHTRLVEANFFARNRNR